MAIVTAHSIGSDQPRPTVETKSSLVVATAWDAAPNLYCDRLTIRVNGIDDASLSFDFGKEVRQPGDTATAGEVLPINLEGKFIRVTQGMFEWVGYIVGEDKDRESDADGDLIGNRQFFRAVGLAYFLDRFPIHTGVVHDGVRIERGLAFNGGDSASPLGRDPKHRGNKHPVADSNGQRGFYDRSTALVTPLRWSAADILSHVLYYHAPRDPSGNDSPCKYLIQTGSDSFLNDWEPTARTENRTPYELLNSLVNPKRGLCWRIEYFDLAHTSGYAAIIIESVAHTAITLSQGGTLPANGSQQTLNFDGDAQVISSKIKKPAKRAYQRVVCRGARQTGTGTVGVPDSTLNGNWDAIATEPAYLSAASSTDGDGALTDAEKKERNDAMRRQDEFDQVFSSFAVPSNWDGLVGDGKGGVADTALFPVLNAAGAVTGQLNHYWSGLRVMPRLMITAGGVAPDPMDPQHLAPFALVKVATSPDRYHLADKLANADYAAGTPESTSESLASYGLYAEVDVFGVRLRSSKGLNHTLAKSDFGSAEPTATEPELDWRTLRVTVSVEADAYCEGVYPDIPAPGIPMEELVIDMGDSYRLDYIAPNTVIGIDEGQDVLASGGVLRDDRVYLQDFARFAFEWYNTNQRELHVTFRRVDVTNFTLGTMITTVGAAGGSGQETVNTVIGEIAFDFNAGITRVQTIPSQISLPELLT